MIVKIKFLDKNGLIAFEARAPKKDSGDLESCQFDSEILRKARGLKGFWEISRIDSSKRESCCVFCIPLSSFKSVDDIRALFAGNDANVLEFAFVYTKEEAKSIEIIKGLLEQLEEKAPDEARKNLESKLSEIKSHRSDELIAERFNGGKAEAEAEEASSVLPHLAQAIVEILKTEAEAEAKAKAEEASSASPHLALPYELIVEITFMDEEDLVQFDAQVLGRSEGSFASHPFDSETLYKVKSLVGFQEMASSEGGHCCTFRVPRSSFENVDSIRALFAGYTEVGIEGVQGGAAANAFEFALVYTKEELKRIGELELSQVPEQEKEIVRSKLKPHRSDELMAERFEADKISSPSP